MIFFHYENVSPFWKFTDESNQNKKKTWERGEMGKEGLYTWKQCPHTYQERGERLSVKCLICKQKDLGSILVILELGRMRQASGWVSLASKLRLLGFSMAVRDPISKKGKPCSRNNTQACTYMQCTYIQNEKKKKRKHVQSSHNWHPQLNSNWSLLGGDVWVRITHIIQR